ncbi:amino acid ABC transporter permease [Kineothrix sedimenti]|uniref:Amino acid ABC transporter permease n=1 Tax=Kineothrix sedimenti TaxID=3123317 RepID=A0ABZ3ERC4_9FIRM
MDKGFAGWVIYIWNEYWPFFLKGTIVTLEVAILGTILGFLLGFLIGILQSAPIVKNDNVFKKTVFRLLLLLSRIYVEIFRSTPMMVQGMVIFYGLKSFGPGLSSFWAAVLVTMLNTGAYMSETVRGGIISIDYGQQEGAKALGMSHVATMYSVILPQAFRNIIPEMVNMYLTNLKMTSVLNVINVAELYFVTKTAAGTYYRYFEAYIICGLIYFVLCTLFTRVFSVLEKKLDGKKNYELAVEYMEAE